MPRTLTSRPAVEVLEDRLAPATDVLGFHYNITASGVNATETALTPSNVNASSFGKVFTASVDGQVYAEPLIKTGVTVGGVSRDLVIVATEHNSLYAFDANASSATTLWHRSFLNLDNPHNNPVGASFIIPVPSGDTNSNDLTPEVGITGTPVIDDDTDTLFVVVKTKEFVGGTPHWVQRLHAINLSTGSDVRAPFLIGDTTGANTNNTPIYVYGSGDGRVTDPYNGTGRQVVQFHALREHQRASLNLVNDTVYVSWASHGDNGPYHGWVVGWDISQLTTTGWRLSGVLNTTPNSGLSGIWQSGGKLAFEPDGSAFYFETGNGLGGRGNPTLNANGFPVDGDYSEALVKVVADPTTSATNQNINGWGLKVVDFFIPYNQVALDNADSDFGSGAPLILPASAGIAGHPKLMVAGGKEGKLYLIDRDNLGRFSANADNVINAVPDGAGHVTPPKLLDGLLSTPVWFNNKLYAVSGYNGRTYSYTISATGTITAASQSGTTTFGYLPGSPVVSANGTLNGIVWVPDRNLNALHAYSAATLSTELWNSVQNSGDALGAAVKFATPTVANGRVYVGTMNSLVVYGLAAPPTAVPAVPTNLTATSLSGTSLGLSWNDTSTAPNTAAGYKVEISVDGIVYFLLTTIAAGSTSVSIGGLQPQTQYRFRLRSFNAVGTSGPSNIAGATTGAQTLLVNLPGGFASAASQLTRNGSAAIAGTRLRLTGNTAQQAGSVFTNSTVDVSRFETRFQFQLSAGNSIADGFTFTLQGVGPTALGPAGGGLGYGPSVAGGTGGIANSVAVKFDLFSNGGEGPNSIGVFLNGARPTTGGLAPAAGSNDLTGSGIDLHSGHVFEVTLTYDGTNLSVTIRDTTTNATVTRVYVVNIAAAVGSAAAYAGFTGGTGGLTAIQEILNWTFASATTASPSAPSGLGATPASATSVHLTWTNNATNQTGYHLDRATDANFTQNLITLTLPAAGNAYDDTATGLAPGGTFHYRLRAFNSAGDSGNSNVAPVTIPLAPPTPTDAAVTDVTATTITLRWTDNAGHQAIRYRIERKVGSAGTFSTVALLPPTSRTPPSEYVWTDENLTPGVLYEYHVIAENVSGHNDFSGSNATTLPAAPVVTIAVLPAAIRLDWAGVVGAVGYNIYRNGGLLTTITGKTWTDTAVTRGVNYVYRVSAINGNGNRTPPLDAEGAPSIAASAVVTGAPSAPKGVRAVGARNLGVPRITILWNAVPGAGNYNVYRSLTPNGPAVVIARGVRGAAFVDRAVRFRTPYYYRVTALGGGRESVRSAVTVGCDVFDAFINFSTPTGEGVGGYVRDAGLALGAKPGSLRYGWRTDSRARAVDRDSTRSPTERHDSFNLLPSADWWAIAVPNGTYSVRVLAGDPLAFNSVFRTSVGGVLAINGAPTSATRWLERTVTVRVTTGVLYVRGVTGARNNKINSIDVRQL